MKLVINDAKKIGVIQKEFTSVFPFLKIEFFAKPHKSGEASAKKIMKSADLTIGECRRVHNSGSVTINGKMTVNDLEQTFSNTFGLSVQVFRKSGRVWLETTVTDGWSLDEQNKQGEELSRPVVD
ncbi:MAG: hypothetical protein J0M08_12200 [Bacteroidetes bacterium]|nr:hypothetical protein [Bacteroidota bacterium]